VFTAPLFQGYFDTRFFGFAVWGENLANVSQFVAEIGATRFHQVQIWPRKGLSYIVHVIGAGAAAPDLHA